MKKIDYRFILEAEKYVENLLQDKLADNFYYHDFKHAMAVKSYVEVIGNECKVNDDELNLLRFASLFHDTGFINSAENHVEHSIEIATQFLNFHQIDKESIDKVKTIIEDTKMPQNPTNKLSEIICDADLMYIAEENCYEHMEAMYEEAMINHAEYSNRNLFDLETIRFFLHTLILQNMGEEYFNLKRKLPRP